MWLSKPAALAPMPVNDARAKWTVVMPQPVPVMGKVIYENMKAKGVKTIGYIGYSDSYGDLWFNDLKNQTGPMGMTIVDDERFARPDTSVAGQVLKLVAANPDAILVGASGTAAALPEEVGWLPARAGIHTGRRGSHTGRRSSAAGWRGIHTGRCGGDTGGGGSPAAGGGMRPVFTASRPEAARPRRLSEPTWACSRQPSSWALCHLGTSSKSCVWRAQTTGILRLASAFKLGMSQ